MRLDQSNAGATRVLLVEDNPADVHLIRLGLKDRRYDLLHVSSLGDAMHEDVPEHDVMLLDLHLPDSIGIGTLTKAKASMPDVPIVVLTGVNDDELAVEALRAGAHDYLVKGGAPQTMVRALRYAIERKRNEELQQRLVHADRLVAIGQIAAGVAHGINNPAAFLIANTEHMARTLPDVIEWARRVEEHLSETPDGPLKEEAEELLRFRIPGALTEWMEIVSDNLVGVERIRSTVEDLRVFSRIERKEVELVSINETIRTAAKLAGNQIRHRAQLQLNFEEVKYIAADRGNLTQTWLNLLINAAHAIESGDAKENRISVDVTQNDHRILVRVTDSGHGIDPADLPKIFQPFYTTKPREVGTGLGLAISAETIRRHRGHIDVRSTLGEGTVMDVTLPFDTGLVVPPMETVEHLPVSGKRGRIMVVDDDPGVLRALRRTLSRHEVVEVVGAVAALEILTTERNFDVILSDVMMPTMDGPAFYDAVQALEPRLIPRMVFMSGGAFSERGKELVTRDDVVVLDKPIPAALLETVVGEILQLAGELDLQS